MGCWLRGRDAHARPGRRGGLRGRSHRPRRPPLRRARRGRDRRARQARLPGIHRYPRALGPPRLAPPHHRLGSARLLRPAVPRHQRAARGHAGGWRSPLLATDTIAEMLRNGITTFMEFGSQLRVQEALLGEVDRLGLRAYLGAGYDSGRWVGDEKGRLKRVVDEAAGVKEFESAMAFIRKVDGTVNGRVRGLLAPREVETCSLDLLRATRKAADELRLPIVTHAAYNIIEFYEILREHRMTPVELMESVGLLGPDLTIGHGNLIADNALLNYSGGRDLELMGRYGVTVSHCPVNIARRARSLDSWAKYRAAGINLALGSDTYPRDQIMQMRMASYFGKVMSHNLAAASAAEVFEAATLGGARALGRTDLGRLAPGAKADIVVIDLETRDSLRFGPVRDPIKALVECGIGDDVVTVIVDGVLRMRDRVIPGVDLAAVRRAAQDAGERVWERVQEWDPLERTAERISPWSFPIVRD